MRGHQQSNTRKLNKHWQSGNRGINVFNDPLFIRAFTFYARKKSNDTIYLNNEYTQSDPYSFIPNVYDNPYGFLKVPDSKKIKIYMYAEMQNVDIPNTLHAAFTNLSNTVNDPVVCRLSLRQQNSTAITYHTLLLSECTDKKEVPLITGLKNTEDDTYSGSYSAYCISTDKKKPSIFEVNLSTFLNNVDNYRVDIFPAGAANRYSLYYETAPKGLRYNGIGDISSLSLYFTTTPREYNV